MVTEAVLKSWGTAFRVARVRKKLTIRKLAELSGVSPSAIVRLEAGEPVMSSTMAEVFLVTNPALAPRR